MIPTIRARAATPPITPPTIAPVLLEDSGAEDEDAGDGDEDKSCEAAVLVEGSTVREDDKIILVEDDVADKSDRVDEDKASWDREDFASRDMAFPSTTNSPLFCLQHASARVPFPQQ